MSKMYLGHDDDGEDFRFDEVKIIREDELANRAFEEAFKDGELALDASQVTVDKLSPESVNQFHPPLRQPLNPNSPIATADNDRNFVSMRQHEAARDRAEADAKRARYEYRTLSNVPSSKSSDPAIDTLILATAAHYPFVEITYPGTSTFVPYAGVLMQILSKMDFSMASTRRWTDNCMGWVPSYSLIYISMLFYIQTIRAMDAAGAISYSTELHPILSYITRYFPLEKLWVPGPLVQYFKNLACFLPYTDGSFGPVTPALPDKPGWRRRNHYALTDPLFAHLPNIQAMISRLRTICTTASLPGMNNHSFRTDVDGPAHCATLFNRRNDGSEEFIMASPGMTNIMAGDLRLWLAASNCLKNNRVPTALDRYADTVDDTWRAFLGIDTINTWFPPVVSMMSKYCQFWRYSSTLAECAPNCSSAAGSFTCTALKSNDLAAAPDWTAPSGAHNNRNVGHSDRIGHYVLSEGRNAALSAACPLRKIPLTSYWAATTYAVNMLIHASDKEHLQSGEFWGIYPNALGASSVHTLPGIRSSIVRDYHSVSRLD